MKAEKKSATVIDLDEARRKRNQAVTRHHFAPKPDSRASSDGSLAVTLMNGTVIRIEIADLSLEGVILRTNEATARTLHAPGQFLGEESPTIEIAIDLPLPDGNLRLLVCCRLLHLEMLSPEDVTYTLEFLAFVGAGEAVLRHFLRLCATRQAPQKRDGAEVCAFNKRRER